jgi:acetoacetyl-CoA reductase
MNINDQVILVTGGTGGIGTTICQHFLQENAKVIATCHHDNNKTFSWEEEQKKLGYDIPVYPVDVSNYESCADLVKKIESDFGRIDVLVNNAGITNDARLINMSLDQWQSVLNTNLDSVFNMSKHVLEGMLKRQYGRIINISSINGQKGQFGQTNYAAAKAGMHGFTKSLAQEVARKGITVNTVSPGYIETSMVLNIPEEIQKKIIEEIPVGRLGKPEEIARVVLFLADSASGFITGANFSVNGGQYLL